MVEFRILSEEWKEQLQEFFRAIVNSGYDRFFHPHPFDLAAAERLSKYQGKDLYYIAVSEKKVIAYGMLRGWDEGYQIPSLGIAIHPLFQNKGLGEEFIRFLHASAKKKGAKKVRITVYKENVEAINFYLKIGYVLGPGENGRLIGFFELE